MLVLLAAAASVVAATPAAAAPLSRPFFAEQRLDVTVRNPSACRAAARIQTSAPVEPALLFRGQDRAAAGPRRLIDMPLAEKCLLGGSEAR